MSHRLVAAALATLVGAVFAQERGDDALRRDMEFAKRQVYPALVNISVVVKTFGGGRAQRAPAAGSGVIVSPAGHVVTNYHVAGDATRIVCRLPNKESIQADVVAHDPLTDLTVLKLRLDAREDGGGPLPFARLGSSADLSVGDYVLAMGNPMGLSSSMTLGIVSNTRRVFTSFTGAEMENLDLGEGQITGMFTRWIQHDALILPGNSGGPLVNLHGEVVGINELGGAGVGFAIPSDLVAHVLNQALTHGDVPRGWFGMSLYPVGRMDRETGVLVASVENRGPAHRAGLRPGDVILSIGGHDVTATHFEEIPVLYKLCADCPIGHDADVVYERGGEKKTTAVRVARMERYLADQQDVRALGATVRDITGPMALVRRYPSRDGVLLTGVRPGYPLDTAKPGVQPGDVLLALDGKPVTDFAAFAEIVAGLGARENIPLRLRRNDEEIVTVFSTKRDDDDFGAGELPKAWIGVRTQVVTPPVADALGLGDTRGFRVTQVFERTQAAKAGLRVGDVITALDGAALDAYRVQDSEMLKRRVETLGIDDSASLTVVRDGKEISVEVVLEESPASAAEAETAEDPLLEYRVRDITFGDRIDNRWPHDQQGVLVTQVTAGGWASMSGLHVGDLIEKIGDRAIADVDAFEKAVTEIREKKPEVVRIFLRRGYRTVFVFVQPEY